MVGQSGNELLGGQFERVFNPDRHVKQSFAPPKKWASRGASIAHAIAAVYMRLHAKDTCSCIVSILPRIYYTETRSGTGTVC